MTFNEALEYHGLNKPKDTPFTSTTSSPEVVKRFNQDQIAQIDIPEHALRELLSGQKAARVPYEKYGDRGSKYLSDREWVFTKIPKENWKNISGSELSGSTEGLQQNTTPGDPLSDCHYYYNQNGERVFRFWRGLNNEGY